MLPYFDRRPPPGARHPSLHRARLVGLAATGRAPPPAADLAAEEAHEKMMMNAVTVRPPPAAAAAERPSSAALLAAMTRAAASSAGSRPLPSAVVALPPSCCTGCPLLRAELDAARTELGRAAALALAERRRAEEAEARMGVFARVLGRGHGGGGGAAAVEQYLAGLPAAPPVASASSSVAGFGLAAGAGLGRYGLMAGAGAPSIAAALLQHEQASLSTRLALEGDVGTMSAVIPSSSSSLVGVRGRLMSVPPQARAPPAAAFRISSPEAAAFVGAPLAVPSPPFSSSPRAHPLPDAALVASLPTRSSSADTPRGNRVAGGNTVQETAANVENEEGIGMHHPTLDAYTYSSAALVSSSSRNEKSAVAEDIEQAPGRRDSDVSEDDTNKAAVPPQLAGQKRKADEEPLLGNNKGTDALASLANAAAAAQAATTTAAAAAATAALKGASKKKKVSLATAIKGGQHKGNRGDPRMNLAVSVKMSNLAVSLLDALVEGGFVFPAHPKCCSGGNGEGNAAGSSPGRGAPGSNDRSIVDTEGVSLYQRKNQLNRRLRRAKADRLVQKGVD